MKRLKNIFNCLIVLDCVCPGLLPAQTLELDYSTYLGGGIDNYGGGITLGTGGEVYVTGSTWSSDFPTNNPYQASFNGGYDQWGLPLDDVFVSKLSLSGSGLIYSTYLGGSRYDIGSGIALGTGGEAHVTGWTDSTDFPTNNPYQAGFGGVVDVFVSKLSSSGSGLIYSTYLGGDNVDEGCGIALGTGGEAYVTGESRSTNFPTKNSYQARHGGGDYDVFVSRLSSSGSVLIYSTYLGGSNCDYMGGITLGTGGEAYVTGDTWSSDFPTNNPYQASSAGGIDWNQDVFISKLSSSGSSLIYSTYLGGSSYGYEGGRGITLGTGGEAYITGSTWSTDFPTNNPYQAGLEGCDDGFVCRLSSSGSVLIYSTYLGGSNYDNGHGIAMGTAGEAYVTGSTSSMNFPTNNPYQAVLGGVYNVFVSKLSSSGSSLAYSTYLGGEYDDNAAGIALGTGGEAYVTGDTTSLNFPTKNPYQASYGGGWSVFVSKLIFVTTPSPSPTPFGYETPSPTPVRTPTPRIATPTPRFATPTPRLASPTPITIATPTPIAAAASLIDSGDYDGDGTSDVAIFRESQGLWSVRNLTRAYFGAVGDVPVSGDYDGDGTTDVAIFRESGGLWSVRSVSRFYLGVAGDVPVPGDYLGNGTAEAGLFRASAGLWAIRDLTRAYFGLEGDSAIPGYYSPGGVKGIAVFRGSTGMWSVRDFTRFYFGVATDDLVPGDYTGAGKWEGGIFRGFSGLWSIRNVSRFYLGLFSDAPVPADFNGDGKDDAGIFRDSRGMWALRKLTRAYFGATGDIPVTR